MSSTVAVPGSSPLEAALAARLEEEDINTDSLKRIGPLLNQMLEEAQRTGTSLPTDDYDLATYIHTHVDSSLTQDEKKALFRTLHHLLSTPRNVTSPSEVHDALEVSATTVDDHNNKNHNGGDDSVPPTTLTMPQINVLAATMTQLQSTGSDRNGVASPVEDRSVAVASMQSMQSGFPNAPDSKNIVASVPNTTKALVVVDQAEFERCVAVKPYVLAGDKQRCTDPNSEPKALPDFRFKIAAPLKKLSPDDPFFLYETAELYVEEGFHIMSSWGEAVDKFKEASTAFEDALMVRMAANCMIRAHDVYKAVSSFDREMLDDAAYALVAASRLHIREMPPTQEARFSALACLQNGIAIFKDLGRERTTSKLLREAAEICILVSNPGLAVDMLHVAADTNIKFGQFPDARACLARAAEISVMDFSDFAEAVDTLEKMATVTPSCEINLAYFRALACRIVCVPPVPGADTYAAIQDVKKTFDDYQDSCPSFCYGPEYKLLKVLIGEGLGKMNDLATEESISIYLKSHESQIEQWLELVLRKIHKNIVARKLAIDRTHTL